MRQLVSVIIPAYNKAQLTVKTVESVLSQTYSDIEIIVVDDGSIDETRDLLSGFGDRIRYVCKINGGASSARNLGAKLSRGEYLAFLDCDDLYEPRKVERCVESLESRPNIGFVHTAALFVDDNNAVQSTYSHPKSPRDGWIAERLIMGNYICNSTVMMRRHCFFQAGGFDENIFPPADWDMWLRLSERYQGGYLAEPLTRYRVSDNYTFHHLERSRADEMLVLENFFRRNPRWRHLEHMAHASFHVRYAQCHLLKNDLDSFHAEMSQAFKLDFFNIKAWGMSGYFWLAPGSLKKNLERKILRCPQSPGKSPSRINTVIRHEITQ